MGMDELLQDYHNLFDSNDHHNLHMSSDYTLLGHSWDTSHVHHGIHNKQTRCKMCHLCTQVGPLLWCLSAMGKGLVLLTWSWLTWSWLMWSWLLDIGDDLHSWNNCFCNKNPCIQYNSYQHTSMGHLEDIFVGHREIHSNLLRYTKFHPCIQTGRSPTYCSSKDNLLLSWGKVGGHRGFRNPLDSKNRHTRHMSCFGTFVAHWEDI